MATGGLGALSVDLLLETKEWTGPLTKAELETSRFAENVNKYLSNIAATTKKVEDGLKNIEDSSKKTGQSLDDLGAKAWTAVKGFLVFETVKEIFSFVAKATMEAEEAAARLDVVMRNVGAAAGLSAERIDELADSLGRTTQFDDESFRNAAAAMIRYGGVTQDVLERSLKAAADFAAFTGTDLVAAADALGKAVASPAQGIERLQRSIGYIDEETKRYIKTLDQMGDTAAAQAEILALVEKATKGAAEAMGETATGQVTKFGNAIANLAEAFGKMVVNFGPTKSFLTMVTDRANELATALDKMDPVKLAMFLAGITPKSAPAAAIATNTQADADRQAAAALKHAKDMEDQDYRLTLVAIANQKKREEAATRALEKRLREEKQFVASFTDLHVREVTEHIAIEEGAAEKIIAIERRRLKDEEQANKEYLSWLQDQYGALYRDIEELGMDAFGALFGGVKDGWKGLLKELGADFKKMLMGMVSRQVVQPFLNQLIQQVGGGLGQFASSIQGTGGMGSVGQMDFGSMIQGAASLYDKFFGASSAVSSGGSGMMISNTGAIVPAPAAGGYNFFGGGGGSMGGVGYGIVGGVAGGLAASAYGAGERGVEAATNYGALGAQVGSYFGPWGAIAGWAIGTIAGIATDPDPDAMRKAFFGETKGKEGVTKWAGSSALGDFGFSAGEWLSDSDMDESMSAFIQGIAAMDNALANFLTDEQIASIKTKLADAGKTYELGMEHGGVTNLGKITQDRLAVIAGEFNATLGEFVASFDGPVEDIVALTQAVLMAGADFDPDKILEDLKPKGMMESYQEGNTALVELIENLDFSAASINELVNGMGAFQQATVQMVAAIDAVAASMHAMFQSTADNIRMSLMSEEERYQFLQERSQQLFAQLLTETDPAKIQALGEQINADINAAWAMLDESQRQALGEDFLSRLTMVDTTVADKMQALRDIVIEDADTIMQQIADRLDGIFVKGEETANINRDAANTNLQAAQTPVVVVVSDGGAVTSAG